MLTSLFQINSVAGSEYVNHEDDDVVDSRIVQVLENATTDAPSKHILCRTLFVSCFLDSDSNN
jgi:hypothetical protein